MPISAKDIHRLELADLAAYRNRYVPGAEHVGIYRIFAIWPDKLKEIAELDGEWRENAVVFLEVDPVYFRSGYDKAQLLRHLKRAELNGDHKRRLRKVALTAVEKARSVEFRQYCQLAARLASQEMAAGLAKLAGSPDALVGRRAKWMLEYVLQGMKGLGKGSKLRRG